MRKSLRLSLILFCSVLLLVSCSELLKDSDDTSTLTLNFNGAGLRSGSRNVTADSADTTSYWITVAISGDYTGSKTVTVDGSPTTCQVVFDDITPGSSISIEANVFSLNNRSYGCHKYTGSTSNVAVGPGQTDVSIAMRSIETDFASYLKSGQSAEDNVGNQTHQVRLYENGKYVVIYANTLTEDILSEGLYEGALDSNGTIYLKEYVYRNITVTQNADTGTSSSAWGEYVFAEAPKTVEVIYEHYSDAPAVISKFNFTSANSGIHFYP
ncbi:MAG: hypothetical protein K6E51_06780 [Treponema sp.]|nr:hypothetical protein [Treponema sp.]